MVGYPWGGEAGEVKRSSIAKGPSPETRQCSNAVSRAALARGSQLRQSYPFFFEHVGFRFQTAIGLVVNGKPYTEWVHFSSH